MKKTRKHLSLVYDGSFQNKSEKGLSLEDVHQRILRFMRKHPRGQFTFVIGTDSQAFRNHTRFITVVLIHCKGKGGWFAYKTTIVPRKLGKKELREKISTETSLSEEVGYYFNGEKYSQMEDVIQDYIYEGASIEKEIHLDIGDKEQNRTREFVEEMMKRVENMDYTPQIKPFSYVASGISNYLSK